MGRRKVVEVRCDRCKKVEYQDPSSAVVSLSLALRSSLGDAPVREVTFSDLCERCVQVVLNYADKIGEVSRRSSEAKKDDEDEAESRAVDGQLPPPHR